MGAKVDNKNKKNEFNWKFWETRKKPKTDKKEKTQKKEEKPDEQQIKNDEVKKTTNELVYKSSFDDKNDLTINGKTPLKTKNPIQDVYDQNNPLNSSQNGVDLTAGDGKKVQEKENDNNNNTEGVEGEAPVKTDADTQRDERIAEEEEFTKTMSPLDEAYLSQLEELTEPGDKLVINNGVGVVYKGVKGSIEGELEITYNGEGQGYTVRSGIKVGAGVDVGQKLGLEGSDAEAMLNLGGYVEHTFETPEAAAKTAGIITAERITTAQATQGPIEFATNAIRAAYSIASGEQAFLLSRLSAIEFSPEVVAELGANMKPLVNLGVEGSYGTAARIEFDKENGPSLVLQQKLSVEGGVNLGPQELGTSEFSLNLLGLNGKASIELEHKIPLDVNALGSFFQNPVESIQNTLQLSESEVKLKLSYEGSGSSFAGGASVRTEFELSGKPSELINEKLMKALAEGNLVEASHVLGDNISVKVTQSLVTQLGIDVEPGLKARGVGVEAKIVNQRTNHQIVHQQEGTLNEILFGPIQSVTPEEQHVPGPGPSPKQPIKVPIAGY